MVACPRGGEVLFAVKIMFLPCKEDVSDAYSNTTLLCGEVLFVVKIIFLPCKEDVSDAYSNTALLCGERKFAATREQLEMRACGYF